MINIDIRDGEDTPFRLSFSTLYLAIHWRVYIQCSRKFPLHHPMLFSEFFYLLTEYHTLPFSLF